MQGPFASSPGFALTDGSLISPMPELRFPVPVVVPGVVLPLEDDKPEVPLADEPPIEPPVELPPVALPAAPPPAPPPPL